MPNMNFEKKYKTNSMAEIFGSYWIGLGKIPKPNQNKQLRSKFQNLKQNIKTKSKHITMEL